jgi:suppressor for copper-sensitivity B
MIFYRIIAIIIIFLPFTALSANNDWHQTDHGKIRIQYENIQDNKTNLNIEFSLKDGWHIYNLNAGDIGYPPKLSFNEKIDYHIDWPEYKTIHQEFIGTSNIYEGNILLPAKLNYNKSGNLAIKLDYLVCNTQCIPESINFNVNIPDEAINTNISDDFILMMLFAVIAGFILNFMPCVLPILSIKLLSIAKARNLELNEVRTSFIFSVLGIISSFLLFGIIIASLKTLNIYIGWGTHFQNSYFIIFLIIILFLFVLSLLGKIQLKAPDFIYKIGATDMHNKYLNNFLSGALAALLATPCSAPIVGTVVAFALDNNPIEIITILTLMGVGLSIPYLLIASFPKMVKLMPKSGKWMITFEHILGVMLLLTIFWLIYVIAGQLSIYAAIILFMLLILFKFTIENAKGKMKLLASILIIISIFWLPHLITKVKYEEETQHNALWQKFEPEKIKNYLDDCKIVIIDVTANWCITCKFNKITVLETDQITNILSQSHIIAMRADFTNRDDDIAAFLKSHKRHGIPFNIVYGPAKPDGIALSEILSIKELIQAINEATDFSKCSK